MESKLNAPKSPTEHASSGTHAQSVDFGDTFSSDRLASRSRLPQSAMEVARDAGKGSLAREALLDAQKNAFAAAMIDRPLAESLQPLVDAALGHFKGEARVAFYRGDTCGTTFTHIIGMTEAYAKAVEGFTIGPDSLACGLAIHRGEAMVTPDVMCDARWEPWRWMAVDHNYRGCWSFPVRTTDGPVLGTLAFYFEHPRHATPEDLELAAILTHAATIIISRAEEVSKRAQAMHALEEKELRLRQMLGALPTPVYTTDAEGRITHFNRAAVELAGRTPQESDRWCVTAKLFHANGAPMAKEDFPMAVAIREGRPIRDTEAIAERPDGTRIWCMPHPTPLRGAGGEVIGGINVLVDITVRKNTEERLANELTGMNRLHELSTRLLQQPNLEQVMKEVMLAAAGLLDAARCTAQLKDPMSDFLRLVASVGFGADFVRRFSKVARDGMTTCAAALVRGQRVLVENLNDSPEFSELKTLAGPMGIQAVMSTPLLCGDAVVGMFTIYWDRPQSLSNDQLRWIDLYVQQAARQIERRLAEQAKDNFLAQLSHELRTPLTPVLMTAASLREDQKLPEDVRQQFALIERNVALEARLIDDLLDLTRLSRGKLTLQKENCDLHAVLGLVLEMVRDEGREKQIEIAVALNASQPEVNGDPARLQQIFWNLLRNAVKFTPSGGRIDVASVNRDKGICVTVHDSGIGFAPDEADRLFQPFEQGAAAGDPRFPGLGLGLSISRSLAELHGGRIHARSAGPGQGATFTVELANADAGTPSVMPCNPRPTATAPDRDRSRRLLLVEDHRPTLDVLARLLRQHGHTVIAATSVAEARTAARQQAFDALISDLGLPDGSGHELMEFLRGEYGLTGIALSGYGAESDTSRSRAAGFAVHLTKPADVNDIRRALRQMDAMSAT